MTQDIVFISVYRCARCSALLEATDSEATGWLRCPRCGRPGLPPAESGARGHRRAGSTGRHAGGRPGVGLPWWGRSPGESAPGMLDWSWWLGIAVCVAVPVLICLLLGWEPVEAGMLAVVMALAMMLLMRPKSSRHRPGSSKRTDRRGEGLDEPAPLG